MRQIDLLDSTLRDGAQSGGIAFSVEDKLQIVEILDSLGIPFLEAGNPGSNPKDLEFFRKAAHLQLRHTRLVAFGSTVRKGEDPMADSGLRALLEAGTEYCSVFGKSSLLHVEKILQTTPEENLRMIRETCRYLAGCGRKVLFDAEHFLTAISKTRNTRCRPWMPRWTAAPAASCCAIQTADNFRRQLQL